MKKLLTILTTLLILTACTSSKKEQVAQIEVKDNQDPIILKVDDKNKLQDYLKDYTLENADQVDLSKEGEHTITLITKDNKKIIKNIIITSNVEETTKKIADKTKQDADTKKPANPTQTKNDKPKVEEKEVITSSKQENQDNQTSNTTSSGISVESNTSGLDYSNHIIAYASNLVGKPGLCDDIAAEMLTYIHGNWVSYKREAISQAEAQVGDMIFYDYNPELGYGHVATYLGNGLALHGNMGSANHTAIIGSVNIPNLSNPRFYKVTNIKYAEENNSGEGITRDSFSAEQCGTISEPTEEVKNNDDLLSYCIAYVWN